jgi:hypothetical protein
MSIVGRLDLHRKQLTFDYVDTTTGELKRGQIAPADRRHLAVWLKRFDNASDVAFAGGGLHWVAVRRGGASPRRDGGAPGRAGRHRGRAGS